MVFNLTKAAVINFAVIAVLLLFFGLQERNGIVNEFTNSVIMGAACAFWRHYALRSAIEELVWVFIGAAAFFQFFVCGTSGVAYY